MNTQEFDRNIMNIYVTQAQNLRKVLHEIPEPSMREVQTKQKLIHFIKSETLLEVVDCECWFYAVWRGAFSDLRDEQENDSDSISIAIRGDYDAVTGADGTCRHLCGHDGHAAILAAFAKWISDQKPAQNIYLLFQPGEETGEGAMKCCEIFHREHIDEIYGFHNIPGFPTGKILLRDGTFACASTGLCIQFYGTPSHAAYPEHGKNPAEAIAKLILEINSYVQLLHRGMVLSTVIGIDLGSESYGMSASEGTLRLTVRAEFQDEFEELLALIQTQTGLLSEQYNLGVSITEIERFPSTENHTQCVRKIAEKLQGDFCRMEEPRRWSEDFGWYLRNIPGAFVGVGAGETWPQLHTDSYEFNDEIIPAVLELYRKIVER